MGRGIGEPVRRCRALRPSQTATVAAILVGAIAMAVGVARAGALSASGNGSLSRSHRSSIEKFVRAGLRLQHTAQDTWINEINADASNYSAAASFCSPGTFASSAKSTKGLGRVMQRHVLSVEHAELPLYGYATAFSGHAKSSYHTYLNRVGTALDNEVTVGKSVVRDATYVTEGNCSKAASELKRNARLLAVVAADARHGLASLQLFAQSN